MKLAIKLARGRPWWITLGVVAAVATGVPVALMLTRPSSTPIDARPAPADAAPLPAGVRELAWTELMPPDWDPRHPAGRAASSPEMDAVALAALSDDDPAARRMLADLQDAFERAPLRPDLNGQRVRLRGYVVPLGVGWGGTDEFLLVPYYGACIHSPPPPPNQIVHVKAPEKIAGVRAMSVVTVTGRIEAHAQSSVLATSGYRLVPEDVRLDR